MCVHSHTEPPCWLLRVLLHVLGGGEREKGGREGEGPKVLAGIDGEVAFKAGVPTRRGLSFLCNKGQRGRGQGGVLRCHWGAGLKVPT